MDLSDALPLLRCVECGHDTVVHETDRLRCPDCGAVWTATSGIYDLRPTHPLPLPRMYDDPHYRRWNERLASAQDYFYRGSRLVRWVQESGHRHIRSLRRNRSAQRILDLGCGDGAHLPWVPDPGRVIGIDIDLPSLRRIRERFPQTLVFCADGTRLPFRDAVFDELVSVYALEHLVHLDFALEEAARVMAPGGRFYASVPAEGGFAWVAGRHLTTARRFTTDDLDYLRVNQIDHCNCIWQIDKALRRHFRPLRRRLFPLRIPGYHLNLVVTWELAPRTP